MTKINFFKNKSESFVKMEVSGHTGYGEYGLDTLCAAVSAIVQAGALGITQVLKVNAKIKRNDKQGYFLIELPFNVDEEVLSKTQVVFETMLVSLKDLQSGYSKFISLEVN